MNLSAQEPSPGRGSRLGTKCFNRHRRERLGCVGCHHAFHVIKPGEVTGGVLQPPRVKGPDFCSLCHEARHPTPVPGCPHCEEGFPDRLTIAMDAAKPIRHEIHQLQFMHWFVGWQARVTGWFGLAAGITWADWFERADGSRNWFAIIFWLASVPIAQWAISRRIARRERLLPSLGPNGEIVYGVPPDEYT